MSIFEMPSGDCLPRKMWKNKVVVFCVSSESSFLKSLPALSCNNSC